MATKQLSTALQDIKDLVGDSDLDNGFLTNALNEASYDLADVLRLEAAPITINLVAGKAEYTAADGVPSDDAMVSLHAAYIVGNDEPLFEIPTADLQSTGLKFWGGTMTVQPTPTENATLKLFYFRYPAALSVAVQTATLDTLEHWQHLHIKYAAAQTQAQAEELDDKDDFMADYLRGRALLDQATSRKLVKKKARSARAVRPWT